MTTSRADSVDEYVAALTRALRGPRRAREDLVAEARDSLVDATEAYQARGMERAQAERSAVRDFGELGEIAAGYRPELALAQARKTAVLLSVVVLIQPIVWAEGRWPWIDDSAPSSAVFGVLNQLVEILGMVTIVGAVLAVAACGVGVRWETPRRFAAGLTAVFTLACCAALPLMAAALGLSGNSEPVAVVTAYAWATLFVVVPLGPVAVSARRALAIATS